MAEYKDRISEKFQYLASAPTADPDGIPTVVRFSRKSKEHYVRSEVDGKPSGWTALYIDGKWEITDKRKKPKK